MSVKGVGSGAVVLKGLKRKLIWNTLEYRREYLSLVESYKTVFEQNGLDFNDFFEYC